MSTVSPTVFVVDDEAFQLIHLGGILRNGGYAVEAFSRPEALLARLSTSDRGCVVLDLQMPGLSGLDLQQALVDRGALLPLIFVSGRADVPAAVSAMKQGALDFLAKPVDPEELCTLVARALKRDEDAAAERAAREHARARWAALTPREVMVCRLSARGLTDKQVAAELSVAQSTVQAQRARALQKLQVSSVPELARLIAQAGDEG